MTDNNIDLSGNDGQENNVLRYIYMLQGHLDNLSLVWRGLRLNTNKKLERVSEPFACDSFVFEQINVLSSVLNPHNFVSNVSDDERNNIILASYASFLYSMNREPTINKYKKPMMQESFFNTLLLFLNILKDGAGATFTLGAQAGVTTEVYKKKQDAPIKPIMDIPRHFGFGGGSGNNNRNYSQQNTNEQENNQEGYE